YKYAGHYTLTEHTMSPEVLVMSLKAWETLSPDDRKIFREEARRSGQFMREKWRDLELQSRKQAETAGVVIVTDIDRKPFEAALTGVYAKAQRDPASAKLIERIRNVERPGFGRERPGRGDGEAGDFRRPCARPHRAAGPCRAD